jgi:hypothetical protein
MLRSSGTACEPRAVSEEVTVRLLNYLLADLKPHLPTDVGIKVTGHAKWTTVQRADGGPQDFYGLQTKIDRDDLGRPIGGHGSGVAIRDLVSSLLLIPRSAPRQIAVKSGLSALLDLAYPQPKPQEDGFSFTRSADYGIATSDSPNRVLVSYQVPGSDERIELKRLPRELFE